MEIRALTAEDLSDTLGDLAELLHACVHAGASVNFVLPFSGKDAQAFWMAKVLPGVRSGGLVVLVAEIDGALVGTVQFDIDTPPNQPHRAEVRKLLVHPDRRRRGIGKALMAELERRALAMGRTLLTLDTRSGDDAEPLYVALGYQTVGQIPGYCRDPFDGRLDATTIMFKTL